MKVMLIRADRVKVLNETGQPCATITENELGRLWPISVRTDDGRELHVRRADLRFVRAA